MYSPLMNEPKGWGSQPILGKDWGDSEKCDDSILAQLSVRFEDTSLCEGKNEDLSCASFGRSTNTLEFEIEASNFIDEENPVVDDSIGAHIFVSPYHEKKFLKKRVSEMNKRRRMSLWATMSKGVMSSTSGRLSGLRKVGATLCPSEKIYTINVEASRCLSELKEDVFPEIETADFTKTDSVLPSEQVATNESIMTQVFSFLNEIDLVHTASSVCTSWADMASTAHARLIFTTFMGESDKEIDRYQYNHLERTWKEVHTLFPWACFLAEGGAKRVYKVYNRHVREKEALSVMDTYSIQNKQIVANELAISVLLGSLSRRGICPNFVKTRGFFTSAHMPSDIHWGGELNKNPKGNDFDEKKVCRIPREPRNPHPGRYQYIRMELVNQGDAEETIKRQPNELLDKEVAQAILFQVAFALHVAADKFSFKHYDLKLLNVFLQKVEGSSGDVVMRYGLGSHMFALRMPSNNAFVAKLADFGTANIDPESNGQPLTIAQFTTLENTPPDFMILGDDARQGHGHDNFGLGLCMLHLFTGSAPYEEILEEVRCPSNFKKRLRLIWESDEDEGFNIVSSLIQDGVVKDEVGHVIEGEPDETLYDTLYRHLVLFGIPETQFKNKKCTRIWNAIADSFPQTGNAHRKKRRTDIIDFKRDSKKFSLRTGSDFRIRRARESLQSFPGGMELLFGLCSFDPSKRTSAIEVLNSQFMESLREEVGTTYSCQTTIFEYTAFSTHQSRI
jgi:serine/threonine protein kinase